MLGSPRRTSNWLSSFHLLPQGHSGCVNCLEWNEKGEWVWARGPKKVLEMGVGRLGEGTYLLLSRSKEKRLLLFSVYLSLVHHYQHTVEQWIGWPPKPCFFDNLMHLRNNERSLGQNRRDSANIYEITLNSVISPFCPTLCGLNRGRGVGERGLRTWREVRTLNSACSLLASGSDDQHTIVWDPLHHKKLLSMHTGHTANIFSVKVSRMRHRASKRHDFRATNPTSVLWDQKAEVSCDFHLQGFRGLKTLVSPVPTLCTWLYLPTCVPHTPWGFTDTFVIWASDCDSWNPISFPCSASSLRATRPALGEFVFIWVVILGGMVPSMNLRWQEDLCLTPLPAS